jgi:hypothetical protein
VASATLRSDQVGVVLSVDPSKSLGWAIVASGIPVECGVASLGTWFRADLDAFLARSRARVAELERGMVRPLPARLVVERAPPHGPDQSASSARLTIRGLVEVEGAVAQAGLTPGWAYPWEVEPNDWRGWYRVSRARRRPLKRWAVRTVMAEWPDLLPAAFSEAEIQEPECDDWPAADAAEAVMLGVGAWCNRHLAPRGPATWWRKGGDGSFRGERA